MKQSLQHCMQQHLNKKQLSSKQLKQLLLLQEHHQNEIPSAYFSKYTMATVFSVLILSIVTSLFYFTDDKYPSTQSIAQLIAEEVAGNHLKLKPLEVSSNKMNSISNYFKQLNFSPVTPTSLLASNQTLLGGRYCSIQGVTALQLRLINTETNKIQSLYEADYDKQVFKNFFDVGEEGSNSSKTIYVKGLKVDIWVEKDILFALIE